MVGARGFEPPTLWSQTRCVEQSTTSGLYYFRVAVTDAPPVIASGPFLAAGLWPVLPTLASQVFVLDQNYFVLWTFSDDYASCSGLCTHRARYRKVGEEVWTWLTLHTDPTGKWYAYVTLPVGSLENGIYQFRIDTRDCIGQIDYRRIYYFKVDRPL